MVFITLRNLLPRLYASTTSDSLVQLQIDDRLTSSSSDHHNTGHHSADELISGHHSVDELTSSHHSVEFFSQFTKSTSFLLVADKLVLLLLRASYRFFAEKLPNQLIFKGYLWCRR